MPDFSLEVVFIALSLMIAIFVMIESTLLERNGGKLLLKNSIFMFISLSTSAWMVAACLAWYFFGSCRFGLGGSDGVSAVWAFGFGIFGNVDAWH